MGKLRPRVERSSRVVYDSGASEAGGGVDQKSGASQFKQVTPSPILLLSLSVNSDL